MIKLVCNKHIMWKEPKIISSSDENVKKFVFTASDAVAEAVLYKYPTYKDRTVICCSTQSGCPVGCRFCGTGDYFVRSLTKQEILDQVEACLAETGENPADIERLQIMFMSMGEPMHNINNLSDAIIKLHEDYPHAKLLISTSAPQLSDNFYYKLMEVAENVPTVGLQFSIHESTDEARKKLIPTPTKDLFEIKNLGEAFHYITGRKPFINYCVHPNNNSQEDVDRLVSVFNPSIFEATLSVICERDEHIAAANERQRVLAQDFSSKMLQAGYNVRVFNPAGQDDIGGGCGQLWFVQDWMKQNPSLAKKSKGFGMKKVHTPC